MTKASPAQHVLFVVLLLNLAITFIKLIVGLTSGSLSVVADAFHSMVDSFSNIIGLIGVWVSARPADVNHPYGHLKYETVAALGIGGMLLVAGFEIGKDVIARLTGVQTAPVITPLTIGLMAFTLVVNLAIVAYETRAARRLQSSVLLADAAHTRTDLLVTLSVIISLGAARFGLSWLDPLVAGVVVVLLVRAAFGILRSTSEVLTDVAVANPDEVKRIALSVPGVHHVSGIRSRGRTDAVYMDLNVRVNPAMDTDQAHAVASEVEHRLSEALPGVVDTVVHIEPERPEVVISPWEGLSLRLRTLADGLGIGLHDLHAHVERDGSYTLEMHVEVDAALTVGAAHALADDFERRVRIAMPEVHTVVTHIEPLPAALPDEAGRVTRQATLRQRLQLIADRVAGNGAAHSLELHNVSGHLTVTLHVTQPAEKPLQKAHELAETIELEMRMQEPRLDRIVVHVEPPE
jgi:cation diffusion facilitator family transporter